jgi:endonuclease/exonuclease/phosphatase family metal-dependent hydrolase
MGKLCVGLALFGFVRLFGYATDRLLSDREIHQVRGEPARFSRVAEDTDRLKVITWNIERGQAYSSILAVLRELDADILLLQEVDRFCRRSGFRDVARDLADALDMNWVSGGEFQEIGEARGGEPAITGQAILSRFPIDGAEVLRFTSQDKWRWSINPVQPRRGGRIALKARSGGILLYNAHIESGDNDALKRRQIADILADQSRSVIGQTPVLIGGDFNNGPILRSPMLGSLTAAAFVDALGESKERPSTSSGGRHPIDWIFVRNLSSSGGRVGNALAASDHSPVIASLHSLSALAVTR